MFGAKLQQIPDIENRRIFFTGFYDCLVKNVKFALLVIKYLNIIQMKRLSIFILAVIGAVTVLAQPRLGTDNIDEVLKAMTLE